ncbi:MULTISPECIES: hypothetical protein [unclassified Actinomyces]|uniref:hypothetical protein n=1 Tax=unclassified Actinomyces TaxID=2609248 RepID=UPI002017AF5D|nr:MULTISPECIES: hypothetical protein [unclassified Actinomyces]MCL3778177.1 hypothetical protein [Actinomyces sp. AC-20-1]MCL3790035.1 hypothetical protein [Actinomyces sp. 187325]MCL3792724.1 hypothetical protein [Actinomyces sp. 186855]MCL3793605.1 hypothetical protein [Actinomyces sp. 217892]
MAGTTTDADTALRKVTETAEREQRLARLRVEMDAGPPDAEYMAERADWESDRWM